MYCCPWIVRSLPVRRLYDLCLDFNFASYALAYREIPVFDSFQGAWTDSDRAAEPVLPFVDNSSQLTNRMFGFWFPRHA